jgi:hypothetical protein
MRIDANAKDGENGGVETADFTDYADKAEFFLIRAIRVIRGQHEQF